MILLGGILALLALLAFGASVLLVQQGTLLAGWHC